MLTPTLTLRRPFKGGTVISLGYIGSYVAEHAALVWLSQQTRQSNVVKTVLQPLRELPGDYARAGKPLSTHIVPINASQRIAIEALKYAVEKIQGPPGTGKSTTIYHIIAGRLPSHARVLVTCSRNVAVESIAQKLIEFSDEMLVVGNPSRIG